MATTSSGIHNNNPISSTFQKTAVRLHDWWLIKAQNGSNGKVLAVGGFTSQGTTRIFSSAPIVKRYDMFTLQTADGITVSIKGYINKTRTHENGISFEVCNHFLIGFPFNWEKFNHHCVEGSIPTNILSQSDECGNFNNGESKGKFFDNNSEDPAVNFSDASAEILDPSKIELLKTGDISKENKADLETPSKAFKNNRGDCSTESIDHIGDTLKDQTVQKFSNVGSIKNTEGKSSPHLSSIEKLRYLSNRIHAICGSKRKRSNFCDTANQDFVNNTETPAGKKSCFDKDSITSSVDHFGITQRAILTSPNDAPRGSANYVNSNKDTAQHDNASNDCLTESGSRINTVNPSEAEILSVETPANCSKNLSTKDAIENSEKENMTSRNRSKVVSSFDKINGDNETSVPVGLRRSGRLRSVKEVVYRDFQ